MPQKLSQFAILSELAADRSSWNDVRHYPSTVICRRMLRLAAAAGFPAGCRVRQYRVRRKTSAFS